MIIAFFTKDQSNIYPLNNLTFSYVNTYRLYIFAQLILSSSAICQRFAALNRHLNDLKTEKLFAANAKFRQTFMKLCDGLDIINETFTRPLIFPVTVMMVITS